MLCLQVPSDVLNFQAPVATNDNTIIRFTKVTDMAETNKKGTNNDIYNEKTDEKNQLILCNIAENWVRQS